MIGFAGAIGAGKTTAADHLVQAHGFVRHRFAGPLKDMMRALGLSPAEVDGDRKEQPSELLCGRTPRWAMQSIGTEWGRDLIHPDLWATIFAARAGAALASGARGVVADDVRFQNEVDTIHRLGGIVVRVARPAIGRHGHASELQALAVDHEILNDGPVLALQAKVDRLI